MSVVVPKPVPISSPKAAKPVSAAQAISGAPIAPLRRMETFSPEEWEDFTYEWVDSLQTKYVHVERCGGAGDMGRDVIAWVSSPSTTAEWDNYQCKRYAKRLAPHEIIIEVGKLLYYTSVGAFKPPRKYYFVSPKGIGTELSNLLKDKDALRIRVVADWDKYCRKGITSTKEIPIDSGLNSYILAFDFGIFEGVAPLAILRGHQATRWYVARFGGGLPPLPPEPTVPAVPTAEEATYVRKLLDAYGDNLGVVLADIGDLSGKRPLHDHFLRSRKAFHNAGALRNFSRDTLPPGEFARLQNDMLDGLYDVVNDDHPDGFIRVKETCKEACRMNLSAHALHACMTNAHRHGVCHQLANEDKLTWVR